MYFLISFCHAVCAPRLQRAVEIACRCTAVDEKCRVRDELRTILLDRHNRTFSLTSAGEVFYRRSLVLRAEIEQLVRETQRAGQKEHPELRLGCYQGYQGQAFALAIELSAQSPLANLDALTAKDLRNLPCILVARGTQQAEEQAYCTDVLGLHSEFRFARTFEEARLMVLTAQGYLPVDTFEDSFAPATAIERIPLVSDGQPVTKNYCAFWKTSNRNPHAEEFAQLLQVAFSPTQVD